MPDLLVRKGRFSDSFFGLSERKGEKVVHRVETLDQMVELDYSVPANVFFMMRTRSSKEDCTMID